MLTIRRTQLTDCEALAPLLAQLGYPSAASAIRSRFAPLLDDSLHHSLVAEIARKIVGFIGARLDRSYEYDGLQARILALVVDEGQRGRGIGKSLVDAVERWSRERGAHKLTVNTSHRRRQTHEFYQRAGFESTGLRFVKPL